MTNIAQKPLKDYHLNEPIESDITIIPELTSGIKIASISVNGESKDIFSPET